MAPGRERKALYARQHQEYRTALKQRLARWIDPVQIERLRDVIAIGTASYARKVRESVSKVWAWDQKRALRRRAAVEEVRAAVESMRGAPWGEFAGRYGDWGRPLFLWGFRQRCGVTLREAGQAAGGMKPAAVDAALKRLAQRARSDRKLRSRQAELLRAWKLTQ